MDNPNKPLVIAFISTVILYSSVSRADNIPVAPLSDFPPPTPNNVELFRNLVNNYKEFGGEVPDVGIIDEGGKSSWYIRMGPNGPNRSYSMPTAELFADGPSRLPDPWLYAHNWPKWERTFRTYWGPRKPKNEKKTQIYCVFHLANDTSPERKERYPLAWWFSKTEIV